MAAGRGSDSAQRQGGREEGTRQGSGQRRDAGTTASSRTASRRHEARAKGDLDDAGMSETSAGARDIELRGDEQGTRRRRGCELAKISSGGAPRFGSHGGSCKGVGWRD